MPVPRNKPDGLAYDESAVVRACSRRDCGGVFVALRAGIRAGNLPAFLRRDFVAISLANTVLLTILRVPPDTGN